MTEQAFRELLVSNREEAIRQLFDRKVEEWLDDGMDEVVRVLTLWESKPRGDIPRIDLGDDDNILELAQNCRLVEDPEDGECGDRAPRAGYRRR